MRTLSLVSCLGIAAFGCATTNVTSESPTYGGAPKPQRVLVYAFATSPDEVQLDHSLTAQSWRLEGLSVSAEDAKVGHDVADKLANHLVEKLIALGLPAERAVGGAPRDGIPTVVIEGQFLTINEGTRTERVVIGLGLGRSDVRTAVQVTEILPEGSRLLDTFEVNAKSDSTPGMAETMGAGAVAGHLAASAAVSAGKAVASEELGTDVDADALRTATQISKVMQRFFVGEGWIAASKD